jgi:hypothetical protein
MHVSINERDIGPVEPGAATVGELVEALAVHVDPGDVLTAISLDGAEFSAGDADRFASRAAISVARLGLTTMSPLAFAAAKRVEVAAVVATIGARTRTVAASLRAGDVASGGDGLATLAEELRLALVLAEHLSILDGDPPILPDDALAAVLPALVGAAERRDWARVADLLDTDLAALLERAAGS